VPDHLVDHSKAVGAAAFRLATWLRERGERVDPLLAHRGGLLHDIAKVTSRRLGAAHNEMGARILSEKGQEALAEIARRHLIYTILDPSTAPATWEEKLVYYSDKVVVGDELASVEVRVKDLCMRYPAAAERIRRCLPRILDLESEICTRLGTTPEEVYDVLRA
jgi:putative hydrolase of the HAD superfamily